MRRKEKSKYIITLNLIASQEHNLNSLQDKWSINYFTDIEESELAEKYFMQINVQDDPTLQEDNTHIIYQSIDQKKKLNSFNSYLQSSQWYVDWRQHSTDVSYQGSCGACWAFATADTVASRLSIKKKLDIPSVKQLSKTQLIDCATYPNFRLYGCRGGWPKSAMEYIHKTGLVPEYHYRPYNQQQQYCTLLGDGSYGKGNAEYTYETFPDPSQVNFLKYLITIRYIEKHLKDGPVIVVMYSTTDWFNYESGELDACSNATQYLHAMQIVGFNYDHWLIKNSWGHWWGEDGYFRISKKKCTRIYRVIVPKIN